MTADFPEILDVVNHLARTGRPFEIVFAVVDNLTVLAVRMGEERGLFDLTTLDHLPDTHCSALLEALGD